MTKICTKCQKELPITEFNKKTGDQLQPVCKTCQSKYFRKYYKRRKAGVSLLCKCGCGKQTKPGRLYVQGHDARVKNPVRKKGVKEKIGLSIKKKWQDPVYRKKVIASLTKS